MTYDDTPIVHQRRLRFELRRLREAAELTRPAVAEILEWSVSKVLRIEHGDTNVGITDLQALLKLYRVDDESKIKEMAQQSRASRKKAWWTPYRSSMEPALFALIGYEASAIGIFDFRSSTVPDLLRTPAYASALGTALGDDEKSIETTLAVQAERQRIVDRDGPELGFVLEEAVLRRLVGGSAVMSEQLQRLLEVAAFPNASIWVLPLSEGAHFGVKGCFSVLDLEESGQERILALQSPVHGVSLQEGQAETGRYLAAFEDLRNLALTEDGSRDFISQLVDEIGGG